jgi:hypothetical protein
MAKPERIVNAARSRLRPPKPIAKLAMRNYLIITGSMLAFMVALAVLVVLARTMLG